VGELPKFWIYMQIVIVVCVAVAGIIAVVRLA
jgi:hypothetical protein